MNRPFNVRLSQGATLFGGTTAERMLYTVRLMNFGMLAYKQPASILKGRIIRVATQVKW